MANNVSEAANQSDLDAVKAEVAVLHATLNEQHNDIKARLDALEAAKAAV